MTQARTDWMNKAAAATGVKLDVQTFATPWEAPMLTKWAAGERPDIIVFHLNGNWLSQLNLKQNINYWNDATFIDQIDPKILKNTIAANADGHLDPTGSNIVGGILDYPPLDGIWYNKKVFAANGLSIPKPGFDAYKDLLTQIRTKVPGVDPIVLAGGAVWPTQMFPYLMWSDYIDTDLTLMQQINSNKVTFNDPRFLQGFTKMKEVYDAGLYNKDALTLQYDPSLARFMSGGSATMLQGGWVIGDMLDKFGLAALNDTVGFFGVSATTDITIFEAPDGMLSPKTGHADKEKAALALYEWMIGPGYNDYVSAAASISMKKGATVDLTKVPSALGQAYDDFQKNGGPEYEQSLGAGIGTIDQYTQEMLSGKLTVDGVGKALQSGFAQNAKLVGLPGFV